MKTKIFLVLILYYVSTGVLLSQPVIRLPFNRKISIDDGLSSYNVKKILQDKYGFTWIVTQDGLNRYDGRSFLIYNKSTDASHQLLASDVWDIEEDNYSDTLWVVTAYGGLNGIDLKTGKVCSALEAKVSKEGFNHDWLRCIKQYKDDLWIGTYDGLTIYNIKKKAFEQFEPVPFKKNAGNVFCIDKIFIDRYENMWIFIANYGIVIYSGEKKKIVNYCPLTTLVLENKPTYKEFNSIVPLPGGILLVGTTQGFRRISYTKEGLKSVVAGLYNTDSNFNRVNIVSSGIDSSMHTWFSTSSRLFKADPAKKTVQEVKDVRVNGENDWFNYIYDIFFDKNNNIWLGTRKGVAYTKNAVPAFIPYSISEDQSEKIDHAFYIYPYSDTSMYVCTETGLREIDINKNKILSLDRGKVYYFISQHMDGNLLVSCQDSFFVYRPFDKRRLFKIDKFYPELAPLRNISINGITYASDSLAVIGTQAADGFYLWDFKKRSLHKFHAPAMVDASEANIINTSYKDNKDRIWILGNKLITLYNPINNEVKIINLINPISKIPYSIFFDVCEARGYYWIAAYGSGLIQLDDNFTIKKVFSIKEGISNTGVYKVFPVNDSLIFISTNFGVSVLNLNTQLFSNYYKEDGLNSNAFEENCGAYKNGKIYFGGISGFTIIDPVHFKINNIPPQLHLNDVRVETASGVNDTSNILLAALKIPRDVLQTTISFSALNYSNPSRTTYEYKIKELGDNWIDLGKQNFVTLIGLGPGKYTLLVRSANENNVWNEAPLELTLIYLPKWYQTILFKILVVLVIMGLLYSFYTYRISQLKEQQKIRKDISADLHDDIGTILEGVKISTHLAKKEPNEVRHLNRIEESLIQATTAFRDVIWVLDDKRDTIYEFMERVKKFAFPITLPNNISLECTVEPGLGEKTFSKTEKRHLLMIVKESINNSIKYAECKNIKVTIRLINNKLAMVIEDDGKGFDVHAVSEGNGLKNLVYRAGVIGWREEVGSTSGGGTVVKVLKI